MVLHHFLSKINFSFCSLLDSLTCVHFDSSSDLRARNSFLLAGYLCIKTFSSVCRTFIIEIFNLN